jgi:hypothetical protein
METIVQRHYDKEKHLQLIKNNIKNSERDDYSILIESKNLLDLTN